MGKVAEIDENLTDLPELDNEDSERRAVARYLCNFSPFLDFQRGQGGRD